MSPILCAEVVAFDLELPETPRSHEGSTLKGSFACKKQEDVKDQIKSCHCVVGLPAQLRPSLIVANDGLVVAHPFSSLEPISGAILPRILMG